MKASLALPTTALTVLLTCFAYAESGPAAKADVPALKVDAVAGLVTGETKDFAAERKEKPTVYVFVQADKFDRPIGRFLKVLDQELNGEDTAKQRGGRPRFLKEGRPDVQVIAVWLTDDVDKSKDYLPKAQMSINLSQTVWSVYTGDKSGPTGWNIDVAASVTAVVADGAKVVKSFDYISVNDTVVPDVLKVLPAKK
jgi:hypothetical protein